MSVNTTQVNTNSHVGGNAGGLSSPSVVKNVSVTENGMQNVAPAGEHHFNQNSPTNVHNSEQYMLAENGQIVHTQSNQSTDAQQSFNHKQYEQQEIKHAETFPPFDFVYFPSHLLWLAITFGFFYFFMAKVVLPRIGGTLEMRRDRIASDLDQAARLKSEVDEAETTYHKTLEEARSRAKTIAAKATQEAKDKAEAERKSVEGVVDRKLADAEKRIAESRDKALAEANKISHQIAADIINKVSGRKVDDQTLSQAIDQVTSKGSVSQ